LKITVKKAVKDIAQDFKNKPSIGEQN